MTEWHAEGGMLFLNNATSLFKEEVRTIHQILAKTVSDLKFTKIHANQILNQVKDSIELGEKALVSLQNFYDIIP